MTDPLAPRVPGLSDDATSFPFTVMLAPETLLPWAGTAVRLAMPGAGVFILNDLDQLPDTSFLPSTSVPIRHVTWHSPQLTAKPTRGVGSEDDRRTGGAS